MIGLPECFCCSCPSPLSSFQNWGDEGELAVVNTEYGFHDGIVVNSSNLQIGGVINSVWKFYTIEQGVRHRKTNESLCTVGGIIPGLV